MKRDISNTTSFSNSCRWPTWPAGSETQVMKKLLVSFILLLAGFGAPQLLRAQTPALPDDKQAIHPRKRGGVFTLYAIDPLSRNLCFTDGKEGMAFVNNKWENRCSDLSYTLAGNG